MFGNGDMGQLGLGPDTLDEIPRPKIHAWYVAQCIYRLVQTDNQVRGEGGGWRVEQGWKARRRSRDNLRRRNA
jgi:hypothetical protein